MAKRPIPSKPAPPPPAKQPKPVTPTAAPAPSMTLPLYWWMGVVVAVLAFAVYSNTLSYGFAMDDPLVVSLNKYVQKGVAGLGDIFSHGYLEGYSGRSDYDSYRPVPLAMYAIEKSLMGGQPQDHHLVNVLLYALATGLLFRFLRRLMPGQQVWLPFLITTLFAVHPLHTEVVANIKSRDEIVAFIGLVLMQSSLLKYGATGAVGALVRAVLAFALAVFSKESAVVGLVLGPLTMYYGAGVRGARLWQTALALSPVVLLYFSARGAILDDNATKNTILENTLLGAQSMSERLASAFGLLGHYYQLVLWPHPLSCDYSYNQLPLTSWGDPRALIGLFITLALGAYAVYNAVKNPSPGGYGAWWFGLTFALTCNLVVLVGATLAERFLFTPLLGLLLLLGWGLYHILPKNNTGQYIAYGITALLALPCIGLTWARNKQWVSDQKLFEHQLVVAPNSARTYITLGNIHYNQYLAALEKAGIKNSIPTDTTWQRNTDLAKSVDYFGEALRIYEPASLTHYSHGLSLKAAGRYAEAVKTLERSVQLDSTQSKPLFHLAIAYSFAEQYANARRTYEKVLKNDPKNLIAIKNMAFTCRKTNDPDAALNYLQRALSMAPKDIDILSQFIKVYRDDKKDMQKAIEYNELLIKAMGK
jgi:protein O-mannosyl-transferase